MRVRQHRAYKLHFSFFFSLENELPFFPCQTRGAIYERAFKFHISDIVVVIKWNWAYAEQ